MKPVIIGQAPAQGNDGLLPFAGKSGARLAKLANLGDDGSALPEYFDLYNVLDFWPGKAVHKGDQFFEHGELVDAGVVIIRNLLARRLECYVIMMGRSVEKAFFGTGRAHVFLEPFKARFSSPDREHSTLHDCIVFPHPSGVSTWWNDPYKQQMASETLRRVLRESHRQITG